MIQKIIEAIRKIVATIKLARSGGGGGAAPSGRGSGARRPNPWPKCKNCYRRVPKRCEDFEDGAQACGFGLKCKCCKCKANKRDKAGAEA